MTGLITPPERMATRRLTLKRPSTEDAYRIFDTYSQDKDVTKFLTWKSHTSVRETTDYLDRCLRDWESNKNFIWLIELPQAKPQLVGATRATPDSHSIELGYLIARQFWRNGYMPEVLEYIANWWLKQDGIFRVSATCHLENTGSARVLEKAGFSFEGILKKYIMLPNMSSTPCDCMLFAKIK